jgi:tRNA-Thr(GGU) m(6)t(6)A37 methyltransferase TsaA
LFQLRPIGKVFSSLRDRAHAPKQAHEGAPDAWLEMDVLVADGLAHLRVGDDILLLTWLHQADRDTLQVHPRDVVGAPLRGVFSTRSQDRPNPIGVHRVRIVEIQAPLRIRVDGLEAFDGTPVIDIKPLLDELAER